MKIIEFVNDVSAQVSVAPEPLVVSAVRTSISDLCQCDVFQMDCDPISERAGQQQYELSLPSDVILLKVLGIFREGRQLVTIPRVEFEETAMRAGTPQYFMRSGATLRLAPVPRAAQRNSVQCRVSVAPARSAVELDDTVANTYYDLIVRGAVAALLDMPMQPWSSPTQATMLRAQLSGEYSTARSRAKGLLDGMRIISGRSAER